MASMSRPRAVRVALVELGGYLIVTCDARPQDLLNDWADIGANHPELAFRAALREICGWP